MTTARGCAARRPPSSPAGRRCRPPWRRSERHRRRSLARARRSTPEARRSRASRSTSTTGALTAPRDGRVQYRVAQAGEVLAAGGKVLNLVDLGDVFMTFFVPETIAGKLALGSEVHIVLDAAPQYVIPAKVSFVASTAQFTPKTVETASERQKLMFPRQGADRPRPSAKEPDADQDRPARNRLAQARRPGAVARRTGGQGPAMSGLAASGPAPVVRLDGVCLRYGKTVALDDITLAIPASCMVGLIGPDGVGKSSLLALLSGARKLQQGSLQVLGGDLASKRHPRQRLPAHRLYAAGSGSQPLLDPVGRGEPAVLRSPVRPQRRRAPRAHR
jgi:hypothetical protein